MRTTIRVLAALTAVSLLVPIGAAQAQRRRGLADVTPTGRHGFWISGGLGAGWESYRFDTDAGWSDSQIAPAFSLALGGTVNPHLRLGGEITGWVFEDFDEPSGLNVVESLVGGLLTAQVYPMRREGLYLKGGLGFSRSGANVEGPGGSTGETGFAALVGAGYEIRLGRSAFVSPTVSLLHHWSGGRNAPDGTLRERVFALGVAFTFQPGR